MTPPYEWPTTCAALAHQRQCVGDLAIPGQGSRRRPVLCPKPRRSTTSTSNSSASGRCACQIRSGSGTLPPCKNTTRSACPSPHAQMQVRLESGHHVLPTIFWLAPPVASRSASHHYRQEPPTGYNLPSCVSCDHLATPPCRCYVNTLGQRDLYPKMTSKGIRVPGCSEIPPKVGPDYKTDYILEPARSQTLLDDVQPKTVHSRATRQPWTSLDSAPSAPKPQVAGSIPVPPAPNSSGFIPFR